MAASQWSVLVFGDSWADYMHPTWGQVLGRRIGAQVFNFARAGSLCGDLPSQAQQALMSPQVPKAAGGTLKAETLAVIHTCGNDFIMKMAEALMGGGGIGMLLGGGGMPAGGGPTPEILQPNPGQREAAVLSQFLETLHRAGVRNFLVSGVPVYLEMPIFNIVWPMVAGMVNSGKLEALGVSPGDPPQLAMQVQGSALHERWEELVQEFSRQHPDGNCVFFDEVASLERLRLKLGAPTFDQSMWDFSMFHPSVFGHEQLASEAHRVVAEKFPDLSLLAPHPEVTRTPAPAPKAAEAPEPKASANGYASSSPPAAAASPVSSEAKSAMRLHVRNVKGDVAFDVQCETAWTAARLREQVLASAPSGFAPAGSVCVLAVKGKFLAEGTTESLTDLGLADGGNVIAVIKPAAKPQGN